ncbi:MAG: hypothetical protein QM765_42785 [Myxococcales bacterium]
MGKGRGPLLWTAALVLGGSVVAGGVALLGARGGTAPTVDVPRPDLPIAMRLPFGEQAPAFEDRSAVGLLKRGIGPDDVFRVEGRLIEDSPPPPGASPLMVVAVSGFPEKAVAGWRLAQPHGGGKSSHYGVLVPSGDYELLVFDDRDGNKVFERKELVGRSGEPEIIVGLYSATDGFTVRGPDLHVDRSSPRDAGLDVKLRLVERNPLVPLASDFYAAGHSWDGLWRPLKFVEHTQGSFLYGVEEFDPKRALVLFVHGSQGRPPEFGVLAASLDPKRFQSWFVYYPSAFPIDKLGAMVADYVAMLGARAPKMVLVGHSMGGLVCRSAIKHLTGDPGRALPPSLKGYVSFAAPYGGMPSAAPTEDVPVGWPLSFLDVVPGSEFLRELYANPYPRGLPFHLFYGDGDHGKGDGTVELWSQLDHRMKEHATRLHGYHAGHVDILARPDSAMDFRGVVESLVKD